MSGAAPSRRGLLGVASVALLGTRAKPEAAVGPDAELLTLVARFDAVTAQFYTLLRAEAAREACGDWTSEPGLADVVEQLQELRVAIGDAGAVTPAGIAAKLRAALRDWGEDPPSPDGQHHIGWSLCRDMAALHAAGGRV